MSRKVTEYHKKEIVKMFDNGTNIKDISKELNFTIQTITRIYIKLLSWRKSLFREKEKFY